MSLAPHQRDGVVLGLAVGVVGATFGVLAETAGLSMAKAMAMSAFVFTGASQFAAIGILESGGSPLSAIASALLLAARNGLYGMRLSSLLSRLGRGRRVLASQFVIDETTALSVAQERDDHALEAFWATGLALFVFWNAGTAAGVQLGGAIADPQVWGLDAVFPASFIALMRPLLADRPARVAALCGAAIAVLSTPFTPAGVPILLAALAVIPALLITDRRDTLPVPGDAS